MSASPDPLVGMVVDGFEILERFASGGFSVVHYARHIATQLFCAVKIIDLSRHSKEACTGMLNELSVFMQVSHPNLATLYRMSLRDPLLFFFQEYFPNGTVLHYVNAKLGLPECECQRLFFQLYGVVRHLHIHHFLVHRDIKLENCLIDANSNLRLVDFGLCSTTYQKSMRSMVGSPGYCPPEVILGIEYSEKCDVFSLGVCLFLMRSGHLPFHAQIRDAVLLRSEIEALQFGQGFSEELEDLILKLVNPKQSDRIGLLEIARHPWMRRFSGPTSLVTPKPIIFFRLTKNDDILKFRRMHVTIDHDLVSNVCKFLGGYDEAKLTDDLTNGIVSDETTVYYLMMYPTAIDPRVKPPTVGPRHEKKRKTSDPEDERVNESGMIGLFRDRSLPRITRPAVRKRKTVCSVDIPR
jgi:serine/threonine protein kinase